MQDVNRNTLVSPINSNEQYYLVDVVAFILKYLKDQLYELLGKSDRDMSRVQFDWVVTVPAIWNARGKQMMREAAYKVTRSLCISFVLLFMHIIMAYCCTPYVWMALKKVAATSATNIAVGHRTKSDHKWHVNDCMILIFALPTKRLHQRNYSHIIYIAESQSLSMYIYRSVPLIRPL